MPDLQLHHVGLRVSDLATAEHFYAQTLGLERLWDFVLLREHARELLGLDAECRFVTFALGATARLEIFCADSKPVYPAAGQHFCLLVPERERLLARLQAQGVPCREIKRDGRRVVFIADPDRNLIELKVETP